jgi:single-strand DNA-binding protein
MNRVILEGRIATDLKPEEVGKHTKLTVLMACDRPRGRDKGGNSVDRGADFIRVVMWGQTALNVAKYLDKGSRIALEGRVRGEFWEKDGRKSLSIEVVADRVTFLESRSRAGKAA